MTTYLRRTKLEDADGNLSNSVYPVNIDIDSIYVSDINTDRSNNGGFSGAVTDYFNDLHSVNTDATATNPKTIKIWFTHSIQLYSIGFGCDTTGKSFSNIKIKIFGSDEFIRETIDDSANSTKFNSKAYDFAPSKANGIIIEFHTADEICLSNIVVWKVTNVNARLEAISALTGAVEAIRSFKGSINVHQSDVHFVPVNRTFINFDAVSTTISTAADAGDTAIIVANTAGFAPTNNIFIHDGSSEEPDSPVITNVAAGAPGTLTLDRPLDNDYSTAATVELVVTDMTPQVGSLAAPISFKVAPPAGEVWHILRINLSATDGTANTDDKFGGIGALTNGMVIRQNLSTGFKTVTNWKNNADIKLDLFDLPYNSVAGPSLDGMNGRFTFKKLDFVVELNGTNGDYLEILVQDDITAQTTFIIKAQGHKASE